MQTLFLLYFHELQVQWGYVSGFAKSTVFIFYRLPSPKTPPMNVLPEVVTEAFGVALVGYVASLALAKTSAEKFKYTVDDNQVKLFLLIVSKPWNCFTILEMYYRWMARRKGWVPYDILRPSSKPQI